MNRCRPHAQVMGVVCSASSGHRICPRRRAYRRLPAYSSSPRPGGPQLRLLPPPAGPSLAARSAREGGDAGPVPAPVAWTAAAMSVRLSSFSSGVAAGSQARLTRSAAEPRLGRAPATFDDDRYCRRRQLSRAAAGYLGAGSGPGPLGHAAPRIHVFPGLSLPVPGRRVRASPRAHRRRARDRLRAEARARSAPAPAPRRVRRARTRDRRRLVHRRGRAG